MLNYWNSLSDEERAAHAERGWLTIKSKMESDSDYAQYISKLMQEKSAKGVMALNELMSDDEYRAQHALKVSEGVSKWCDENPDLVIIRAAKIVTSRNENGTWAIAQKRARENTPKEEYQRRAAKSWETRRKNKANG